MMLLMVMTAMILPIMIIPLIMIIFYSSEATVISIYVINMSMVKFSCMYADATLDYYFDTPASTDLTPTTRERLLPL